MKPTALAAVVLCCAILGFAHSSFAEISPPRIESNGCQGNWQTFVFSYRFTDSDRRNYYYIQRRTGNSGAFTNVYGPYEADSQCVPIGLGFNDYFRAKGCINDATYCYGANYSSAKRVPKRSCAAIP